MVVSLGCSKSDRASWLTSEPSAPSDTGSVVSLCEEGAIRECAEKAGEQAEFVTCKLGIQECRDGVFTPCGEKGVTFITRHKTLSGEGPSICFDNPCNAGCLGTGSDYPSAISNPSGPGFAFEGNPKPWGNAPGGFEGKQDCGRTASGCLSGYPKDCNGSPKHYNRFDGCQADHHCDEATNRCVRNAPGWTWPNSVCPGVDLSVGPACHNGKNDGFPICNRGNTALPAGTPIRVAIDNGNAFDLTCPKITKGTICTITPEAPLRPGECIRMVQGKGKNGCQWNGNAVAYVNSDLSIIECGMPLANPPQNATQPGCSNNWSDIKTGDTCQTFTEDKFEPLSLTEELTATCPRGTLPRWGLLVYDAITPCSSLHCDGSNASSVKFEAQTASLSNPAVFTPWVVAAHAPSPPHTHPSGCTSSGPLPCPVKLGSVLSNIGDEILRLRLNLLPSPDGRAGASLSQWQISYQCEALE